MSEPTVTVPLSMAEGLVFQDSGAPLIVAGPGSPIENRSCVDCKRFEIDFGYTGEDGDPGGSGSLQCRKNEFDEYEPSEGTFLALIRTARTCDKFEARDVS